LGWFAEFETTAGSGMPVRLPVFIHEKILNGCQKRNVEEVLFCF
jgi:hypothetical protein